MNGMGQSELIDRNKSFTYTCQEIVHPDRLAMTDLLATIIS